MTILEQKIVEFLGNYPEAEFYGQEIANKIKCSKASASVLLKKLSKTGIVFAEKKGHMKFYRINPRNAEVKKLKINSAIDQLKPIAQKLNKYSQKIILFGSASRGEQTFNSDIDLLILTNDKGEAREIIKKASASLRIKAIIKTHGEWSEMEVKEPEFYQEVKNGITLYEYVPRI